MSKQFLTVHTVDAAHPTDIFALAATSGSLLSASGSSKLKVHATSTAEFPEIQTIDNAHKLGCHHLVASSDGKCAVSVGFGGEVMIWSSVDGSETHPWTESGTITDGNKAGELWAVALSENGSYLVSTTYDGRINVWDLSTAEFPKIRSYETKGSFGLSIDISPDGELTASGHASGNIYIFSNSIARLRHSLPSLLKPVRAVRFSPAGRLLAGASDSGVISLYDPISGDQIALLNGHTSWILSLDWNSTGEYLLSGDWGGKIRVWSMDTRTSVATLSSEGDKAVWAVKWLRRGPGKADGFAIAGASRSISFYREAAGA